MNRKAKVGLLRLRGTGVGLWGGKPAHTVDALRDEWDVELMPRGLEGPQPLDRSAHGMPGISPVTGLPLVHVPRVVTLEDVRALKDET